MAPGHAVVKTDNSSDSVLFHDALKEILVNRFYGYCPGVDSSLAILDNSLRSKRIDSIQYSRSLDSLKSHRGKMVPKCFVRYSNSFPWLDGQSEEIKSMTRRSIQRLAGALATLYFDRTDSASINEALVACRRISTPIRFDEIDVHTEPQHQAGARLGILTCSQPYYDDTHEYAVLYYELSTSLGSRGEIVVARLSGNRWEFIRYLRVWIT